MTSEFMSLPEDWREQVSQCSGDLVTLIESWRAIQRKPCAYIVSGWAGFPGSECIGFAEEGSDYCQPHGDALKALKAMEPPHKTEGGMCCNGKRGCGGPGSYCCSQTVYSHPHSDGTAGPFNFQESPQ